MSATFRWTCPMSTRGSRLMPPTIAPESIEHQVSDCQKAADGGRAASDPPSASNDLRAPRSRSVQRCKHDRSENDQQHLNPGGHWAPPFGCLGEPADKSGDTQA